MTLKIMDKVRINGLGEEGIILSIHQQIGKEEYQVRYFINGDIKTVYFHDFELEKL